MKRRPAGRPRLGRLIVVLLLPALLLAVGWRWSSAMAQEAPPDWVTKSSVASLPADDEAPEPVAAAATPLMSMRRSHRVIAAELRVQQAAEIEIPYANALERLLGDESCVKIVDADDETVFAHEPEQAVVPASNQKLLIGAAALKLLPPDFVYTTEVRGLAPVDGTVQGSIYLVGGGDPLLSTNEAAAANDLEQYQVATIDSLAVQLVANGVKTVAGDIVGVDTRYDQERRSPDWTAAITTYDVPPLSSLVVDDGLDGAGSVPPDSALTAAEHFRRKLASAGIQVTGAVVSSTEVSGEQLSGTNMLASVQSPPLSTVVEEMLTASDNLTAELLLKEIGLSAVGEGSSDAGLGAVRDVLRDWGVDTDAFVFSDGSGLSSANKVTCEAIVDLLETKPIADELIDDLAVAGVSGTLSDKLNGSVAEGKLRAKTGTLNGVKALSGFQPDASGSQVVFSVILNAPDVQQAAAYEPVWLATVDLIAHHNVPIEIDEMALAPKRASVTP